MYDVIIIGSGTAGMSAGIQCVFNKLKTLAIGSEASLKAKCDLDFVNGEMISKQFKKTLKEKSEYLEFKKGEAISLEKNVVSFSVETRQGENFYARSVIIATGKSETVFDILKYEEGLGIRVNAKMETNVPGIFAAGGANNSGFKNVLIAAGEGAKAAMSAKEYLFNISTKYENN